MGCGLPCVIKQLQPFLQLETVWKNEYFPDTLTKEKQREGTKQEKLKKILFHLVVIIVYV